MTLISHLTHQLAELHRQYGTGIRPSWVSAEIAFYQTRLDEAKAKLANNKDTSS